MIGERQRWAVGQMRIAPDDRVLEIGCGRGVAVSLVCQRLGSGKITAVDRSAAMVRLASQRNRADINAGKAEIRQETFETADLPVGDFDKIFAVNVSLFWLDTKPDQIDHVKRLLAPQGTLYVLSERPTVQGAHAIAHKTGEVLRAYGFTAARTAATSSRGHSLICVSGTLT